MHTNAKRMLSSNQFKHSPSNTFSHSSLMTDSEIIEYVEKHNMISPFCDHRMNGGKISYGLNSAGYDVRMSDTIMLARNTGKVMDPCGSIEENEQCFETINTNGSFIMPPYSFILGLTVEEISLPDDVNVLVIGKSTYARCGIFINITSIENGTRIGNVVLEISNASCNPVKIYTGDSGISKFLFFKTSECLTEYNGTYKDQRSIVIPGC